MNLGVCCHPNKPTTTLSFMEQLLTKAIESDSAKSPNKHLCRAVSSYWHNNSHFSTLVASDHFWILCYLGCLFLATNTKEKHDLLQESVLFL